MTAAIPFACSLGPRDLARRKEEDRALAALLVSHRWEGQSQAVLAFPAHAEPLVERFVAEESSCCPFYEFAVDRVGDEVRLRIVVPEGGEPMLRELAASLTG